MVFDGVGTVGYAEIPLRWRKSRQEQRRWRRNRATADEEGQRWTSKLRLVASCMVADVLFGFRDERHKTRCYDGESQQSFSQEGNYFFWFEEVKDSGEDNVHDRIRGASS